MQTVTSSGRITDSGYTSCTFGADGDYDVYIDDEQTEDTYGEQDQRIRQVFICSTENLLHMADGPTKTTSYGPTRMVQVPGGNSSQVYFTTQRTTGGLPREYYMESALKFCYGRLHVENGKATNLTIEKGWFEGDIFNEKFYRKNFQLMVLLDNRFNSRNIFHLENLNVDYFASDEEFTAHYLAAAKKLNAGLFKSKPTTSSSSSSGEKTWGEIFGFSKKDKPAKPQKSEPKTIPAKKVTNENRPNSSGTSPKKKRSKFDFIGKLTDRFDAKVAGN